MKKTKGFLSGGLRKKTVLLVLAMLVLIAGAFFAVSSYQNRMLVSIVGQTRTEQQQAISQISEETMYQVVAGTLVDSTVQQAKIADNDFAEIVNDTYMLQTMAQELIERRSRLNPAELNLPDPAMDGEISTMVLYEEGVDYTQSEYLPAAGHMSSSMLAMLRNSDKIERCYIGLADGTHFAVDTTFSDKYDADGNLIPFPVRQRPWYRGAAETGGLYFTGIIKDAYSGKPGVTCSAPVVVGDEIVGVVGIDIALDNMTSFINTSASNSGFSVIVNNNGQVIIAPENNGFFEITTSDDAPDLRRLERQDLAQFVTKALSEPTELTSLNIGGREYYAAGAPMPTVGWTVISIVDKVATEAPEQAMLAEYDRINDTASAAFRDGEARVRHTGRIIVLTLFAACVCGALIAASRIARPLEEMTDNIRESSRTGKLFEMKDSYRTNDEIQVLAEAFDDLSKKTRQYIEDITVITREKERVSTELNMANQIQTSMLPHIFPAFPNRHEFDIYATMDPAKEVGGDFYDFFLIDKDHLAMVMADVSGKGVPGALFMMVTKAILKTNALSGRSPEEILTMTNETICSNNKMQMFVTVWLGILEISTGKIIAANAGHEYPALSKSGPFTLLRDRHGLVIGAMEGSSYSQYEIQLEPGDRLFLYTDGVPEATDAENRMFGTERMLRALNTDPKADPQQILLNIRTAVDEFVRSAEQFDDLTMLCLEYNGTAEDEAEKG